MAKQSAKASKAKTLKLNKEERDWVLGWAQSTLSQILSLKFFIPGSGDPSAVVDEALARIEATAPYVLLIQELRAGGVKTMPACERLLALSKSWLEISDQVYGTVSREQVEGERQPPGEDHMNHLLRRGVVAAGLAVKAEKFREQLWDGRGEKPTFDYSLGIPGEEGGRR